MLEWRRAPRHSEAATAPKKKSLAMPVGIVKNGVILQVLGGTMRKLKTCSRRGLPLRLLVIVAGALLLLTAFAPRAKADLIAYYNFEDGTPGGGGPPDFTSEGEIAFFGVGSIRGDRPITTNLTLSARSISSTDTTNRAPNALTTATDPDPPLLAMGLTRSGANSPANFDINLNTAQGFFSNIAVSFAINAQGNGYTAANIFFSTDGGNNFTIVSTTALPNSGTITVSSGVFPSAANNTPLLTIRIQLTGGQSNGVDLQNVVDNITIGGTIVPEPATVAGALLGVLGLCWHQRRPHQRRRLIGSVRLRRA